MKISYFCICINIIYKLDTTENTRMNMLRNVLFLFFASFSQLLYAYGLKFNSTDSPIAQRTSYDVFARKHPHFKDLLDVSFDMALYPKAEIGYIIRIKSPESSQIFNLFFDIRGEDILFRFNEEGKNTLIYLPVNRLELTEKHWFHVRLTFLMRRKEIALTINGKKEVAKGVLLAREMTPQIVFGKSDMVIDVPSFALRRLIVSGQDSYIFPLDEAKGTMVHDQDGKPYGVVENPQWLINEAYHWKKKIRFYSKSVAGSCFRKETGEVYYINKDSIQIYNSFTESVTAKKYVNECPVPLFLVNCFVDDAANRLYVFEVYHEAPQTGPTMAYLDLQTLVWKVVSDEQLPMQMHHNATFFDKLKHREILFGGFGNMHYSSSFYSWDIDEMQWQQLPPFAGSKICPRYFSSMGYQDEGRVLYLFGGMGNDSGDQIVGRRYLYDFYKIDMVHHSVQKLWELQHEPINTVPARGMVIPDDSTFYVLRYPESVSRSFLKLYKFSLGTGKYKIVADSIPILSDKITTNAHLYFNERIGELLVTVQETKDDIASSLTVYSIIYPPVSWEDYINTDTAKSDLLAQWLLRGIGIVLGLIVMIAIFIYHRKRKAVQSSAVPDAINTNMKDDLIDDTAIANSISLFGEFSVVDRNKRNITYLFSPQLKSIFCLILGYSTGDGVSSRLLSDLIWPGKSKEKVKNSRGVAMNQIRHILDDLDGIELIYEKGFFKLVFTSAINCDYLRCMEWIQLNELHNNIQEFLMILSKGKFLQLMDDQIFDRLKEEVEAKLESVIMQNCDEAYGRNEYLTVVELAKAELNIDPINEQALYYYLKALNVLKRENAALNVYQRFIKDYQEFTGKEYPKNFNQLWN